MPRQEYTSLSLGMDLAKITDSELVQAYCRTRGCKVSLKHHAGRVVFVFTDLARPRLLETPDDVIAYAFQQLWRAGEMQ
jgi:hypothetical protein